MTEITPLQFPPEVLARIAPEISLQRHLLLGLRPSLRGFDESRTVHVDTSLFASRYQGELDPRSTVLGSSSVRSGSTVVFCQISGSLMELAKGKEDYVQEYEEIYEKSLKQTKSETLSNYRPVYPIVEIERGRHGAPTDEEMILGQKLYEAVVWSKLIPKESLQVEVPTKLDGEIILDLSRSYAFVLHPKLTVFSRSGPLEDLCWTALVLALQQTRLPLVYIDETKGSDISVLSKNKGVSRTILCDPEVSSPLVMSPDAVVRKSYGIIHLDPEFEAQIDDDGDVVVDRPQPNKPLILHDLEGDAEESAVKSRISVLRAQDGLKMVSIVAGGTKITKDVIKRALKQ